MEALMGIVGLFVGALGAWFAFRADRRAKREERRAKGAEDRAERAEEIARQAPIVVVRFLDKGAGSEQTRAILHIDNLTFNGESTTPIAFPLVVQNRGQLSARNVVVAVRYPAGIDVQSTGTSAPQYDPIGKYWSVLVHQLSDIAPQQAIVIDEAISVPKSILEEQVSKVDDLTTADGVKLSTTVKSNLGGFRVECIVYAEDALSSFHSIDVAFKHTQ